MNKRLIIATLVIGIVLFLVSIPLSREDARPADGDLEVGFPLPFYFVGSGFNVEREVYTTLDYKALAIDLLFFLLVGLVLSLVYEKVRRK